MKKLLALVLIFASLITGPLSVSANGGNDDDFEDWQAAWPVSI